MEDKPKYLHKGTYGCVFKPGLRCSKKQDKKTISKIFSSQTNSKNEYDTYMNKIIPIDPDNIFTIKLYEKCGVEKNHFDNIEYYCNGFSKSKLYSQIVYENGGLNLTESSSKYYFEDLYISFENIFYGLMILDSAKISHLDIKPDNLVYNSEKNKTSLIDFGLSTNYHKIYDYSRINLLKHPYIYYPPEFMLMFHKLTMKENIIYKTWEDYLKENKNTINQDLQQNINKLQYLLNKYTTDETHSKYKLFYKSLIKLLSLYNSNEKLLKVKKIINENDIEKYHNKIDVYMWGITLLIVFLNAYKNQKLNIKKYHTIYNKILKLIMNMINLNPINRITPLEAYEYYTKILKNIKIKINKNI